MLSMTGITIPAYRDVAGGKPLCRSYCPLLIAEECVIGARDGGGPGVTCPGPGTYDMVPRGSKPECPFLAGRKKVKKCGT
jgi:hypothetical protein